MYLSLRTMDHSLDVLLPAGQGTDLCLRTVTKPERRLAILLQKLNLPLPNKPTSIYNVVAKTDADPQNT